MTQGFDGDVGNERSKSFGGTGSQLGFISQIKIFLIIKE